MNDEINEILEKLKDDDWYEELDLTGDKWIELKQTEIKQLLDYITNLQQENKYLDSELENISDYANDLEQENERLKEWKEDLLKENIELENIRKEAIEILHNLNDTLPLDLILSEIEHSENILQNGSDTSE